MEEKIINDEYKIWKKNAPFLYDVVITHCLDWPSLTCQWLPDRNVVEDGDYAEHKLILGTHTSGEEMNKLMIATVRLPTEDTEIDSRKFDEEKGGERKHGKRGTETVGRGLWWRTELCGSNSFHLSPLLIFLCRAGRLWWQQSQDRHQCADEP